MEIDYFYWQQVFWVLSEAYSEPGQIFKIIIQKQLRAFSRWLEELFAKDSIIY